MVKKNGLFFLRKTQERELETQIKERKPEFLESYRVQEERRETVASSHTTNTKTQRSVYRGKEYTASLERTREEKDRMEGRVDVSPVKNGLYSTPAQERQACSELHNDREVMRTPSFRPNAGKKLDKVLDPILYIILLCIEFKNNRKLTRTHCTSFCCR